MEHLFKKAQDSFITEIYIASLQGYYSEALQKMQVGINLDHVPKISVHVNKAITLSLAKHANGKHSISCSRQVQGPPNGLTFCLENSGVLVVAFSSSLYGWMKESDLFPSPLVSRPHPLCLSLPLARQRAQSLGRANPAPFSSCCLC